METALWIIAICEVVRLAQNALQLLMLNGDKKRRDNAYSEFVNGLKELDKTQ